MTKPYSSTTTDIAVTVMLFLDDGTNEVRTLTGRQYKQLKSTKFYKNKVISATKLQEVCIAYKIKIYPDGYKLK